MIVQTETRPPSHAAEKRPQPAQIRSFYRINDDLTRDLYPAIALVDDVLTTGSHFRAAKSLLADHLSDVAVIGLFLARNQR